MKKCTIIYNPNSGKKNIEPYLSKIIELLMSYKYETDIITTKYSKHATEIVENLKNVDLVMSFGGDGTFNEVMAGNIKRKEKILLTHIPVGTTNDIGSMLGYEKNILENVKLSLNGIIKQFDVGLINNHPFVYVAGIGKFTNLSYETPRDLKKKIGRLAYINEAIKALSQKTKLYDITYEIDEKKYRGLFSLIIISNTNHIAGIKNIYKDVKLDDNKFEVAFCDIKKKQDILKALYLLTIYDTTRVPGFHFYRTNNIKIKINNSDGENWCIDGEKLDKDPSDNYTISTLNNIDVLIPKKKVRRLFKN